MKKSLFDHERRRPRRRFAPAVVMPPAYRPMALLRAAVGTPAAPTEAAGVATPERLPAVAEAALAVVKVVEVEVAEVRSEERR